MYVVLGAGGIGAAIGALLQLAGREVVFVARGEHLARMRAEGLRLRRPAGDVVLEVDAVARADVDPGDTVLLAVKSQDTGAAVATLPTYAAVVCAQNGVENEAVVARHVGRVFGLMVWAWAVHLVPGEVALFAGVPAGVLDIGRFPRGRAGAEPIAADLEAAGFDTVVRDDVMAWKHAKLLSNLPGALQGAGRPYDAAVGRAMVAEGEAAYAAAGIAHAPVDALLARCAGVRAGEIDGLRRPGGSLWQSVQRGSGVEVDWLNGYVVRLGARYGVETPHNEALLEAVHVAARRA